MKINHFFCLNSIPASTFKRNAQMSKSNQQPMSRTKSLKYIFFQNGFGLQFGVCWINNHTLSYFISLLLFTRFLLYILLDSVQETQLLNV